MASNRALKVADRIKEVVAATLEAKVKEHRFSTQSLVMKMRRQELLLRWLQPRAW